MDIVLDRLRTELAGRYELEQELGRGGMAVVYLARDPRHDRRVAIKVLRSDLGSSGSERFLREIRTVAQLHHPHILGLHDSGSVDGHLFYIMPYVEGETLREKLEREGQLAVEEAVRIAREVADALDFAHGRGIVHRDIKPENVFLSAGHALVADFGIAKAAYAAKTVDTTLTDAGLAVGTPAYMSPEQATGDPRVDGRSDQYALGCVLYEMLAGQPPFTGPTSQAVMARHTTDPVPPLTTIRAVPSSVDSAIRRALAKAPADRWPTMAAFSAAIAVTTSGDGAVHNSRASAVRRTAGALAMGGAVAAMLLWRPWSSPSVTAAAEAPMRSVVVMPIEAIGDTVLAKWADGFTEAVINALVRIEGLRVPQSSRASRRALQADPRDVGRAAGAEAVLTGTLEEAAGRLRLRLKLIDVATGTVSSAKQYDGGAATVFAMQDSVTSGLATSLRLRLSPDQRASLVRGTRTRDSIAYDLYLQARRLTYSFTNDGAKRAIPLLRQAIARDSSFADAWVAIADAGEMGGLRDMSPTEEAITKRTAIDNAIALDSTNGLAFALRGYGRLMYDWNWQGAHSDILHAVRLSPSSPFVLATAAVFYNAANQPDSALAVMRRAVEIEPTDPFLLGDLARRYAFAGMTDSALVLSERAIAMDSLGAGATWVITNGALDAGRRQDAERWLQRQRRVTPDDLSTVIWEAIYYRRAGDTAGASRTLRRAEEQRRRFPYTSSALGIARLGAGDREGALDALEEAIRNREPNVLYELIFAYTPLVGHPRFERLKRTVFGSRPLPFNPYP